MVALLASYCIYFLRRAHRSGFQAGPILQSMLLSPDDAVAQRATAAGNESTVTQATSQIRVQAGRSSLHSGVELQQFAQHHAEDSLVRRAANDDGGVIAAGFDPAIISSGSQLACTDCGAAWLCTTWIGISVGDWPTAWAVR